MDCKIAKNYLTERKRMCNMYVQRNCKGCVYHTTDGCWRTTMEHNNPEKAIEIVQKWSDEHPQKTLLTEFLRSYPNAELNNCGYPKHIIPCELGLIEKKTYVKTSVYIIMTMGILVIIAGTHLLMKVRKQNEFCS